MEQKVNTTICYTDDNVEINIKTNYCMDSQENVDKLLENIRALYQRYIKQ